MVLEIKINMKQKQRLIESTVLDIFPKLTSDKLKIRLNAGVTLLQHLNIHKLSEQNEDEMTYSLQRIIRGLGSPRAHVRAGYYSVLVTIFSTNILITIEKILDIIKKQLSTSGSNSKGENADICMGQILVCGAFIKSGLFLKGSKTEQQQILEMILSAGKQRSYLSLAFYTFFVELLDKINENQFKDCLWPAVSVEIEKPLHEQTLDTIFFLCASKKKFPTFFTKKLINNIWKIPDIIHKDSMKPLCEILLNVPMHSSLRHPVYGYISQEIVHHNLVKNWCQEMDKLLTKPTRNMFLVTVKVLTLITENVTDTSVIPETLTENFLTITLRTYKNTKVKDKNDEFLNKMEIYFNVLKTILQKGTVDTKTKISVLRKLLFYPGNLMFEQMTRSKLIQQIALSLDADGVKELVKLYAVVVLASNPKVVERNETEQWFNSDRIYAAQLIVKLLNHNAVKNEVNWRLENIKFLLNLGLFKDNEQCFVSAELAAAVKNCFYHALDQKFETLDELRSILSSLVHYIDDNIFKSNKCYLRTAFSQQECEVWNDMTELISKIESEQKTKNGYAAPIFHTLLLHMGLHLFKDFEMAANVLKELRVCFERIETEKQPKKSKVKLASNDENEPKWIEVLLDLFLSLLSHESHLLRTIIRCVFPYVCPFLTVDNIHQVLDILNPKNEENLLSKSKVNNDDSLDEASDEEDNEEVVDNEKEDTNSEESEESELEDEEDETSETLTDKVRMAVRDALHNTGYQTDDESEDLDDMDEEEGEKLNEALSNAFKMFVKNKNKKGKQTKEQKVLLHFRVRALDLIEMYLDSKPAMMQCLEIVNLLLQTMEFSIRDVHQRPLQNRLRNCLRKFRSLKKFESTEGVTCEFLAKLLDNMVEKGSRSAFVYKDMSDIIADCCIFIIRCSQTLTLSKESNKLKKEKLQLSQLFSNYLQKFFRNRDCLIPLALFRNVLQISWSGNWNMISLLMSFVFDNDIKIFKRNVSLELLVLFYSKCKGRISDKVAFNKKIAPADKKFSNNVIEFINTLLTNFESSKIKEKFISLLFTLLKEIKMGHFGDSIKWDTIGNCLQEYRTRVNITKDVRQAYVKLCNALNITPLTNIKAYKEGSEDAEINGQSKSNVKTKRELKDEKKHKKVMKSEKRKLKKETNLLRLKASSEGMSDIAFDNINLTDVKNDSDDNASVEPKRKKSKPNNKTKMK